MAVQGQLILSQLRLYKPSSLVASFGHVIQCMV